MVLHIDDIVIPKLRTALDEEVHPNVGIKMTNSQMCHYLSNPNKIYRQEMLYDTTNC